MPTPPPVLLEVTRNGFVESCHRGSLVVLGPDGAVEFAIGDPEQVILPRSSLKPFQAIAMVESGYPARGELLALAAASHDGEEVHIDGARAILAAAGLHEAALQCPPALPSEPNALLAWTHSGGGEARICHNCSGKHSAMLATCSANGWETAGYRDPAHPLQRAAREVVERFSGERVAHVAVDGCGAPAFGISLAGLARGFAALATATDGTAAAQVRDAMRAHPRMIAGTGQADTELTAAVPGLVCKGGAESVNAAALPDGRAMASKIEDGGPRARPPLLAAVLRAWGFDGPAVRRWSSVPVLGAGEPQGAVAWAPALREALGV